MDINAEKRKIIEQIIGIDDEAMILKIGKLISESEYNSHFKTLTEDEVISILRESEEAYEKGNVISQEDLELEILTWKKKQ